MVDVYGAECKVEKLDCIGHVQVRMWKHLMKLKPQIKVNFLMARLLVGKGSHRRQDQAAAKVL